MIFDSRSKVRARKRACVRPEHCGLVRPMLKDIVLSFCGFFPGCMFVMNTRDECVLTSGMVFMVCSYLKRVSFFVCS